MTQRAKRPRYQDFINELAHGSLYGVFVDDTGSPGLSETPAHLHPDRKSWVGVVVPPHQIPEVLREFPRALEELKRVTGATEFHFADIYSGRHDFGKDKVSLKMRLSLFRFMTYIFSTYELPVFVQTFDPDTLKEFRAKGSFPDRVGPFNMTKAQDAALFLLLIRIKWYLEKATVKAKARVFVDEQYKKNGVALYLPSWESVFADGLICFARSSTIHPIQLADFAAFCLNRTQLLLGKEQLSTLDKELLQILTPMAWNYQNIDKHTIGFDNWHRRFEPTNTTIKGSLARVTIPLPNNTLPDCYGQPNQSGIWPTTLAGFQVRIGNTFTSMIAVKQIPDSNPTTDTVDFLIPDNATIGNEISITVTQTQPATTWNTAATIQATAPVFWSIDGTADGFLLALDAAQLTKISTHPCHNRQQQTLFTLCVRYQESPQPKLPCAPHYLPIRLPSLTGPRCRNHPAIPSSHTTNHPPHSNRSRRLRPRSSRYRTTTHSYSFNNRETEPDSLQELLQLKDF